MASNLIATNGTVVHANSAGSPLCSPKMRRNSRSNRFQDVSFGPTDAAVTCKDCSRKLGTEAPKTRGKVARDTFAVGSTVNTRLGRGTITKLTASLVTYTIEGERGTFAAKRADLRKLNG